MIDVCTCILHVLSAAMPWTLEVGPNLGGISKQLAAPGLPLLPTTHLSSQHVNMSYLTNLLQNLSLTENVSRPCTKMVAEENDILEGCWKVWAIWCGFASTLKAAPVAAPYQIGIWLQSRVLIFNHRSSTEERGGDKSQGRVYEMSSGGCYAEVMLLGEPGPDVTRWGSKM